jgi:hypothetical protein
MSDEPARGMWLDDGPLPTAAAREITDCTVTFTLTPLPLASRAAVVRAMVEAANKILHASNIYPCPQLRHVVEGLNVNLPSRVHGDVATSVTSSIPPQEDSDAAIDRVVANLADHLQGMGVTVVNTAAPLTVYVDRATGREDGHGTQASPFATIARARMHANVMGRSAVVRDLSGRLLYSAGLVSGPPNPPPPPSPPPGRSAITPEIRFH